MPVLGAVVVEPKPPKAPVVPVVPKPVFCCVAGEGNEPNMPPEVPVADVLLKTVEFVKPPVPKPVDPNGLFADIGDCVVAVEPNMGVFAGAVVVVAVLNVNGDV